MPQRHTRMGTLGKKFEKTGDHRVPQVGELFIPHGGYPDEVWRANVPWRGEREIVREVGAPLQVTEHIYEYDT